MLWVPHIKCQFNLDFIDPLQPPALVDTAETVPRLWMASSTAHLRAVEGQGPPLVLRWCRQGACGLCGHPDPPDRLLRHRADPALHQVSLSSSSIFSGLFSIHCSAIVCVLHEEGATTRLGAAKALSEISVALVEPRQHFMKFKSIKPLFSPAREKKSWSCPWFCMHIYLCDWLGGILRNDACPFLVNYLCAKQRSHFYLGQVHIEISLSARHMSRSPVVNIVVIYNQMSFTNHFYMQCGPHTFRYKFNLKELMKPVVSF